MPTITFKVSDNDKHNFLWALLNVNYNEEGNWSVEYGICDIYDEYAIVRNYVEGKFERIYYVKNDETDSLEITGREDCFIVDVNAEEKEALNKIHAANSNTYEGIDAKFENLETDLATANTVIETLNGDIAEVTAQNSTFSTKIEELESSISTLNTEKETSQALIQEVTDKFTSASEQLATAQSTIEALTVERDELATYKKNIIDTEKKNLILGYSDQLSQEVLDKYIDNMDNYDLKNLDMELTYEVKVSNPGMFSKTPAPAAYIPKDDGDTGSGLESLLKKYEKRK